MYGGLKPRANASRMRATVTSRRSRKKRLTPSRRTGDDGSNAPVETPSAPKTVAPPGTHTRALASSRGGQGSPAGHGVGGASSAALATATSDPASVHVLA